MGFFASRFACNILIHRLTKCRFYSFGSFFSSLYSRSIIHGEIRESRREADIEIVVERAQERFPDARPRLLSDNGPPFLARDCKQFIRLSGRTHVKTSPYYPPSNGKIERWQQPLQSEGIRPGTPLSLDDARRLVTLYVEHYNTVRLPSAIGYVTPQDMLNSRQQQIFRERDQKLEAARPARQFRRQQAAAQAAAIQAGNASSAEVH